MITVRELILELIRDPQISIDQQIMIVDMDFDREAELTVGDCDPDPDGYRVLYIKGETNGENVANQGS